MRQQDDAPAQTSGDAARSERALLAQVARLHYLDEVPRVEIADRLGISRFKVARLITRAREEGVVTIVVHDEGLPDPDLARRVATALGSDEVVVVRSHGEPEARRSQVGRAAAEVIEHTLGEGEVLGLTWGRAMTAVAEQTVRLPRVRLVQLTGVVGGGLGASPVELLRPAVERSGGEVHPIFSPLVVADVATAAALRRHAGIRSTLELFDALTTAAVSIGSWHPVDSQVHDVLDADDVARLDAEGCVADVAGIAVRADGSIIDAGIAERSVAVTASALAAVPRVLAVASGAHKAAAVRAVMRAGLVTGLVIDHELAEALLR